MEILKIIDGVLVECLNKRLTSVTIPYGVTSIGNRAFRDCESLICVSLDNGRLRIENDRTRDMELSD